MKTEIIRAVPGLRKFKHDTDIDSTLLDAYGRREREGFNYHYQVHGCHPLLCYDGLTGDLREKSAFF